ncbi:MAG: hypothetical protein LBV61_08760 [Burkholderiaceae bacterium]|jgi:hypothetical protein|nr:hypothetical protein [Burkholderiaceae bacterium]
MIDSHNENGMIDSQNEKPVGARPSLMDPPTPAQTQGEGVQPPSEPTRVLASLEGQSARATPSGKRLLLSRVFLGTAIAAVVCVAVWAYWTSHQSTSPHRDPTLLTEQQPPAGTPVQTTASQEATLTPSTNVVAAPPPETSAAAPELGPAKIIMAPLVKPADHHTDAVNSKKMVASLAPSPAIKTAKNPIDRPAHVSAAKHSLNKKNGDRKIAVAQASKNRTKHHHRSSTRKSVDPDSQLLVRIVTVRPSTARKSVDADSRVLAAILRRNARANAAPASVSNESTR